MERKSLFKRETSNGARSLTFALKVVSYDTTKKPHAVNGVRLDNGEAVTVFLRDGIDFNLRGRFQRSEIADFAAPRKDRNHPGTTPGGILLAQEAQLQAPGVFGARWIQSLSHSEGEAEVFHTTVHVSPVKQSTASRRDYSLMTIIHDGDFGLLSDEMKEKLKITPPFPVQNVDELQEALVALLDDGIGVGVRVSNPDGFDAMYVARKKDVSAKDAVNAFMGNIQEMVAAINSGEMTCEVVPYGNVWAGPATTEIMVKNKVVQSRLAWFNEPRTSSKGTDYVVPIFREAIVAVRMTPQNETGERAVFFSHFEPLNTRYPVEGLVNALAYARSEILSPVVPKPESKKEPAASAGAPAPASNDHGSGTGSFDGGEPDDGLGLPSSDESLMEAAGGMAQDIGDELPPGSTQAPAANEQPPAASEARPARRYGRRG